MNEHQMQLTIDGIESPSPEMISIGVKRPVQTIGIKPVRGELTFLSRRLFHMLVYFIQQDGDQEVYCRTLSSFIKTMNYGSKNIGLLKNTLKELMNVTVEWSATARDSDDDKDAFILSNFVSEVEIKDGQRGRDVLVEWSFPPKLRRQLLNPAIYTRFTQYYFEFKSRYSVALFEFVERYKTNYNGLTCNEPWEWWVPRITGNSNENIEYRYFKRDVLQVAINEINKTVKEYQIELLEPVKLGKKVLNIQFKIRYVKQIEAVVEAPKPINTEILDAIIALGIAESEANKIFSSNTEDFLLKTLEITEQRAGNKKLLPLTSKAGYFKTALVNSYATATVIDEVKKPKKVKEEKVISKRDVFAVKSIEDAKLYFDDLTEAAKKGFVENYFSENKVDGILSSYNKSGFKSSVFKTAFFGWLGEHLYGIFEDGVQED